MQNRDYKILVQGCFYHIFNRGNNKQDIFIDPDDFIFFLYRLKEALFPGSVKLVGRYVRKQLPPNSFLLLSYCIMPNHFHFLIKQNSELSLSKLISKVCTSYSIYFNRKYGRVGQVFQDQFKAVRVEGDSYLQWLSAYIHLNPLVGGLVNSLENYEWSSYLDYIGVRNGTLCDKSFVLKYFESDSERYKGFVLGSHEKISKRKELEYLLLD